MCEGRKAAYLSEAVGCLPLRRGNCCNQGPTRTSPHPVDTNSPSANSVGASLPLSPETASLYSCPCGRPDSVQPMIHCQGPGKERFHLDCAGIASPNPQDDWWCLQCSILACNNCQTYPKGCPYSSGSSLITAAGGLHNTRVWYATLAKAILFCCFCPCRTTDYYNIIIAIFNILSAFLFLLSSRIRQPHSCLPSLPPLHLYLRGGKGEGSSVVRVSQAKVQGGEETV